MTNPTVTRCTARHDGAYWISLSDKSSGVSPVALDIGSRAKLSPDGRVVRA